MKILKQAGTLLTQTFHEWSEDKVPRMGAALAYYSIFSLAPLLLLAIGIAGLFFGAEAARGEVLHQIENVVGLGPAQAIQSVNSNDIQQYIDAIRRNVCSVCEEQAQDGSCEVRRQVQCSLDAYLLLVVDAIEEATGKTFDKSKIRTLPAGAAVPPSLKRFPVPDRVL